MVRRAWVLPVMACMGLACQRPRTVAAPGPVAAELTLVFRDGVATVGLDRLPPAGEWQWMDAGLWSPLPLAWSGKDRAAATVGRTAPDWLLLKDPAGGIHRVVLFDRPDPVPMPTPPGMHDSGRITEEERGVLAAIGVVWVLSFVRR